MFEEYRNRLNIMGGSVKDSLKRQSIQISESLFSNSTSTRFVIVNNQKVEAKITSDSKTTVRGGNGNFLIEFRDGFCPKPGTYVRIPDNDNLYETWLIMYRSDDINFPKHIIKKCNYFLRWKNSKGDIIERWAVFGDNARIQDGEFHTASNKMTLSRINISLVLPCDKETINIKLDKRFIIDFQCVEGNPNVYMVSNRNVISKTFNEFEGVVELAVNQHQFNSQTDSKEEMIADYYSESMQSSTSTSRDVSEKYSGEISYNGTSDLKMGTPYKKYVANFYQNGVMLDNFKTTWSVAIPDDIQNYVAYEFSENEFKIRCEYLSSLIGRHIRLIASNEKTDTQTELLIKVVSGI